MNLLNSAPDEKLGYLDFAYATQDVPLAGQYEVVDNFIVPTGTALIVSGFVPSIAGNFLSVTAGTAFLGYRDRNGTVRNGLVVGVSTIATAALQKNLAGLTQGTYVAYVRFNLIPGTPENRAYYAASGSYAQLTNTRLTATWELNLEPSSITMTAEWLAIASVTIGSNGAVVTSPSQPVDLRNMYFDGMSSNNGAPVWGLTQGSRSAPITSLYTQLDALRQSIVDIKGPGLQGWRSPGIGGMNIGNAFAATALAATVAQTVPTDATLALGDRSFLLQGISTLTGITGPKMSFNAASAAGGYWSYARTGGTTADFLSYTVGSVACLGINSSGYVGLGAVAAAPVAQLHVQPASGICARFDGPTNNAGMTTVQIVGYNTNDPTYLSIGDGASPSSTRRAVWHIGQIAANTFGLTSAGSSPTTYYSYNSSSAAHTFSGAVYVSGQFTTSFAPATAPHDIIGYLSGNNWSCNNISVNNASDGTARPAIIMPYGNQISAFTTSGAAVIWDGNQAISSGGMILSTAAVLVAGQSATYIAKTMGKYPPTSITWGTGHDSYNSGNSYCDVTVASIPANAIIVATSQDTGYYASPTAEILTGFIRFHFPITAKPTIGFSFAVWAA